MGGYFVCITLVTEVMSSGGSRVGKKRRSVCMKLSK